MKKSKLSEFIKHPKSSLFKLSIPVIAAALVETLYTVVDGIYAGFIGPEALAAITFAWPYVFILMALSLGLNSGISSRVARYIGEKNKKQAENTAMHGLLIAFVMSILVAAIGIPLLKTLFILSGANGNVLLLSVDFMFYILLGVIFMFLSYAINSIFSAQGDTKTAMKIDIYSIVLNIILAPIFMFTFGWGLAGAAIATSCAVLFAFIQSIYFLKKYSYLKLGFKCFKFSSKITKEIIFVGFPSTLMMLIMSFYILFLNKAMMHYSVNHVAAFGIVSRLESLITLPIYGLSVGTMTLVGMYYGAKKYDLVKKISWYATWISVGLTAFMGLLFFILPSFFLRMFTSDPTILSLAIPYLLLDIFTFPSMVISTMIGRIMQALGHGFPGLIINIVRVLIVSVPLAYIFVFVLGYGYLSIAIAMILGGVIATIMGVIWLGSIFRKLDKKKN